MVSSQAEDPPLQELINRNWITLTQLAKLEGVTYRTALKWARDGKIKTVKVGGQRRIYEDELRRFRTEGNREE